MLRLAFGFKASFMTRSLLSTSFPIGQTYRRCRALKRSEKITRCIFLTDFYLNVQQFLALWGILISVPFVMTRLRQRPMKPSRTSKLPKLSFELLCVSLQALTLPTSGSRIRLLQMLRLASNADATHPVRPRGRISSGRVTKSSRLISSSRARKQARRCANDEFTDQSPFTLVQSSLEPRQRLSSPGLPVDEPFESPVAFIEDDETMLNSDQVSVIQAASSPSVKVALSTLERHDGQLVGVKNRRTHNHLVRSNVTTPLGVNYQLDNNPEEEIFRGEYIDHLQRIAGAYRRVSFTAQVLFIATWAARQEQLDLSFLSDYFFRTCFTRFPTLV